MDKMMDAVRRDGHALRHVPVALRTPEVCLAAVQQYGHALRHVPVALRTADLCLAAVRRSGRALRHAPDDLRTAAVCRAAVERDSWALAYVPAPLRTAELCRAAVEHSGWALQHVPEALDHVPESLISIGMIADTDDPRPVIDEYGDLVLCRSDAEAADVCAAGREQWIAEHCAEDAMITVADALATGDQVMHVCRVIAAAIRRSEG